MTFLPIVERELRIASRRPVTYWLRFFAVLAGIIIWAVLLAGSRRSMQPATLGHHLFTALSILAFLFSLLAGIFITADCVSEEKREGTLGLLFLTDLRGYDVVFGKLFATSLHTLYSLLAIFPVLALPLLMGGVTVGEFWRVVLVLAITLFLSLSIGLIFSTLCNDARPAMAGTLLTIIVVLGFLPLLCWILAAAFKIKAEFLLWPCPGFALTAAYDSSFRFGRGNVEFWSSIGTLSFLSLSCIGAASFLLPKIWRDTGEQRTENRPGFWKTLRFGSQTVRAKIRSALLDSNPFNWLTLRDRMPKIISLSVMIFLSVCWFGLLVAAILLPDSKNTGMSNAMTCFIICVYGAFPLHLIFKILVAIEASKRLSDDRHSGALELLLVTPLPQEDMCKGHLKALRQQFNVGLFLLILINLSVIFAVLTNAKKFNLDHREPLIMFIGVFIAGIFALLLDFYTLCRVGMAAALRAKKHHRAALSAIGKVMVIPWLGVFLFWFLAMVSSSASETFVYTSMTGWFIFGFVLDAILIKRANEVLESDWRRRVMGFSLKR